MKNAILLTALALTVATCAGAQDSAKQSEITVVYAINGEPIPCNDLKIDLTISGRNIPTQVSGNHFTVPAVIHQLYANEQSRRQNNVDIHVSCSDNAFEFLQEYPATLLPGNWEVGVAYPPHWFERFKGREIEKAMWLSYLVSECDQCDPGIIHWIGHSEPPSALATRLREDRQSATGIAARDSAYALAVFNVDNEKNSAYLLKLLGNCLAAPNVLPAEDVCDEPLLDEIENLYLRGDDGLLLPLLLAAGSANDVVNEIGDFYADLLDRRTEETIRVLRSLPPEKQDIVCKLAGQDGFSINSPQQQRAIQQLRAEHDEVAQRCARVATGAADNVPWRQHTK